MDAERLQRLVYCLERLREDPRDFRNRLVTDGVCGFFNGFAFALRFALGIETEMEREAQLRRQVILRRDWVLGEHPHDQMLGRGFSPEEALSELAAIEIDFIHAVTAPPA